MSEKLERELDWNDTIEKESSFIELAEGDYEFVIDHYERGRFKGSDKLPPSNMAIVFFRIKGLDGEEAMIRENYILHTRLEWKLSELFASVGLKKKGEPLRMDWPALVGLSGRARVTLDPDRNDPSKKFNHIGKLYSLEEARPQASRKFEPGRF